MPRRTRVPDLLRPAAPDAGVPWRALAETSPVPVLVVCSDGRVLWSNGRAAALLEHGEDLLEHVAPGHRPEVEGAFARALAGEPVVGQRWSFVQADGAVVEVAANLGRVEVDGTPALHLQLRDITAQVAEERALRRAETQWRQLFEASPVGIGLTDPGGHLLEVNDALCTVLGRPRDDVLGRRAVSFLHPDEHGVRQAWRDAILRDGQARTVNRVLRPDGTSRWAATTVTVTTGPSGEPYGLAHVQDVTEQHEATERLARSEANLRAVAHVVREVQSGLDARQTIVDAARELGGANLISLLEPSGDGEHLRVTASTAEHFLGFLVPLHEKSVTVHVFRTEQALLLPDAATSPLVSPAPMALSGSQSAYVLPVMMGTEIAGVLFVGWEHRVDGLDDQRAEIMTVLAAEAGVALRQAAVHDELDQLALTDPLTGLPNRRSWDRSLAQLFGEHRSPLVVAIADLDRFKTYNDTYGHLAGDALLRTFARAASGVVRASELLCRWGGEEFALALPCGEQEARAVLGRLLRVVPDGQSASVGYAVWDGSETPEEVVARADLALYEAKRTGRGRVVGDEG